MNNSQKAFFGDRKQWQIFPSGIAIQVPPDIILSLNTPAREKIYAVLAQSPANPAHATPFRCSPDLFDGLMASSDLSPAEVQKVKSLTWSNEGAVCFSDLDLLKGSLPPGQFKDLVETLYSVPALLMRIRIYPDTDVKALLSYWGKGGRGAQIKPFLDSSPG